MEPYITGAAIRQLREKKNLTQQELADRIGVSGKTVSKWETGRGLPDITLLEPIGRALGASVLELISGTAVVNRNVSCNMTRSKIYVCPVCGNVIHASGAAVISCCGVQLPALEAEEHDEEHEIHLEPVEDEVFLTVRHPMTKDHYISFAAFASMDQFRMVKFYPEGNAEARFRLRGHGFLYVYCNRHGLFKKRI